MREAGSTSDRILIKKSVMPTSLVTGTNRGIGLELTKQLRARGYDVIAVCRTPSKELAATGARVESGVDVADPAALAALTKRLGATQLDLVIHNAGILDSDGLDALDADTIVRSFQVNALGPLLLTAALQKNLAPGAKVALITSRMGSIADNSSGGMYAYRMSKAALNMAGVSLAKDLAPRGIAVAILHPGPVKTDMTRGHGQIEAPDAVRNLLARIDELTPSTTGKFLHANGEELPW
jgi:NAD(P)-dependent dehydrogenase (short-subunit alcohol dehydrogenase family)